METSVSLIKIAIVGPESTGKSTISEALARHYDTVCVPEYAREYCRNLDRQYTLQDELNIFYGQVALERSLRPLARHGLLFCDTTFLTVKVWCDHLFGHTPSEVLQALTEVQYDYYLLMDIDLPWEDDPLRDFPEDREHFMEIWRTELRAIGADFEEVSGLGAQRFENALAATERFLRRNRRR